MANYSVQQQTVDTILSWIKSEEIAIPEIQRPFVWTSTKVRDLMDSLYKGYPVGYIITWKNQNIKSKDGRLSEGRKILIDGQQRITALTAAINGQIVLDKFYQKNKITISFHPVERRFEVLNPAISKDDAWLKDIGPIIKNERKITAVLRNYKTLNPESDDENIEEAVEDLKSILNKPIGLIELNANLDIETVTEVFIRINSKGVVLSQADFVMSKIASDERYGGNLLRKAIEYFCHIYVEQEFYDYIVNNDTDFTNNSDFKKIAWVRKLRDDVYKPQYSDVLRVAYAYTFNRAKLSDLVNLLSGRNFEKRSYETEIAEESYRKLKEGVDGFTNQTNLERFLMIIKSIGFITNWFVISKFALNFAYTLYLKLKDDDFSQSLIEKYVKKWFVLSILTARYSGSSESFFDNDIKQINQLGFESFLKNIEAASLSDNFWNVSIIQDLTTSNIKNGAFVVFIAQQISNNRKGFLSKDITVRDMVLHRGDIHHLFPKEILIKAGFSKSQYNQVANFVYAQQEINIKIGKKTPQSYLKIVQEQCETGILKLGNLCDQGSVKKNFKENCIPSSLTLAETKDYAKFLEERRILMAKDIRDFYEKL